MPNQKIHERVHKKTGITGKKFIFLLIICLIFLIVQFLPFNFIINFSHDDAFFYIKTSYNFSGGMGSTFDCINPTNGYHPLYFLCLSVILFPLNFLKNTTPELVYRIVFFFHVLLIFIISHYLNKCYKLLLQKNTSGCFPNKNQKENIKTAEQTINTEQNYKYKKTVVFSFVLIFCFVFSRDIGLESHISILLISVLIYLTLSEKVNGKIIIVKSLFLSLLYLSRTDYLYNIIPLYIIGDILFLHNKTTINTNSDSIKKVLYKIFIYMAAILITATIYSGINYFYFGHTYTISTLILNTFPKVVIENNISSLLSGNEKIFNQFTRLVILLSVNIILFYVVIKKRYSVNTDKRICLFMFLLCVGCTLFAVTHLFFNSLGIREWYMTLPIFLSIFFTIYLFKNTIEKSRLIFTAVIFFCVFYLLETRILNYKFNNVIEYSKKVKSVTNENDNIYQVDFSGITGFFSERKIINGDGLINSFEYTSYIVTGRLKNYFEEKQINYYSTYLSGENNNKNQNFREIKNIYKNRYKFEITKTSRNNNDNNIVIIMPFDYTHAVINPKGVWLLLKTEDMEISETD